MMNPSKLETTANIAIIVLCTIVAGEFCYRAFVNYRATSQASVSTVQEYRAGEHFEPIAGIDPSRANQTLLLVAKSDCRYCVESMPFYRRLTSTLKAKPSRTRVFGICSESADTCARLFSATDVELDDVISVARNNFRIRSTPTLIIIDKAGTVAKVWRGRLSELGELEVMKALGIEP
jgi:hypothetical protein